VKSLFFSGRAWSVLALCLLLPTSLFAAQLKPIQLRNETVMPQISKSTKLASSLAAKASGSELCLIQFSGPLSTETRAQVQALGVDLLHYVPQNTFVARVTGSSRSTLQSLPFVVWVGEYKPEHKLHRYQCRSARQ